MLQFIADWIYSTLIMATTLSDKANCGDAAARNLAAQLRGQVVQGVMRAGDRLLSERMLAQRYDAPLHTVRLALGRLKQEGLFISRPKSGLYVADTQRPEMDGSMNAVNNNADEAADEGFTLLDEPAVTTCDLRFLAASWDGYTRRFWEEACRMYSATPSEVRVEPTFPKNRREYRRLCPWSDAFISTHSEVYKEGGIEVRIEPVDMGELKAAGVLPQYIRAVDDGRGTAIGVPLSACLMVGLLNTRLLPSRLVEPLRSAASWEVVFDLLTQAAHERPGYCPLNVHGAYTFNIHQYLTVAAGGLLEDGRINLRRGEACAALEQLDRFLSQTKSRPAMRLGRPPVEPCLAVVEYTPRASMIRKSDSAWIPWLYPLGEGGAYLEGINVGFVNRGSGYGPEAQEFLLHLAKPPSQELITASPREQPISGRMQSSWRAYEKQEAGILSRMRERSRIFGEWACGYVRVVENLLPALSRQWLTGGMTTDEFCRVVEERGNECMAAAQAAAQ